MLGSGLKEKKVKKSMFRDSLNFVKHFRGKKSDKNVVETPPEPLQTQEQKERLLLHKNRSDKEPVDNSMYHRKQHKPVLSSSITEAEPTASTREEPRYIKLKSGAVVDTPSNYRPFTPSDTMEAAPGPVPVWNTNLAGNVDARYGMPGYQQRSGYGSGGSVNTGYSSNSQSWGLDYSNLSEPRKPIEADLEAISYETLLKEASMLREDLEMEYTANRGSKEELEKQITETKLKIATVQSHKPSDRSYDDIIVMLSKELTDLQKKVNEIEARMQPLDNTIVDIKQVEGFIKEKELDSQQASMLFETIMKKMFDDLSLSGHVLSGEANPGMGLPRNVLEELQGKMHKAALKRTDPGNNNLNDESTDWFSFEDMEDNSTKISNSESHDQTIKKKKRLAREKFQRVSMKLDKVVELTQKRTKNQVQRVGAFRFNAVDRADAFKDVHYFAAPDTYHRDESRDDVSVGKSVVSDARSQTEALQKIEEDLWLGYGNAASTALSITPSDAQESVKSSRSVTDLQALDQHPALNFDLSISGEGSKAPAQSKDKSSRLASSSVGMSDTSGDLGKPPLANRTSSGGLLNRQQQQSSSSLAAVPAVPAAGATESINLNFSIGLNGQGDGDMKKLQNDQTLSSQQHESSSTSDANKPPLPPPPADANSDSLADALGNIQLKKPSERPPPATFYDGVVPPGLGSDLGGVDFAAFGIGIKGDATSGGKKTTEAKLEINIEEKKEEKPKEETKVKVETKKTAAPPPPPPGKKKGGPPPPPPGKKKPGAKGGPPPPPSGHKKASDGLTRAPEVIAMFQEMRKALLGNAAKGGGGPKKIGGEGPADPGALMDELAKNSKYAAQVQADIQNYGSTIQQLVTEVATFEAKDMPEMIEFVKRVDSVLSELTDETAVLKQFDWPARYYTMLEAKGMYEELDRMKNTFKPWKRTEKKAAEELKKIQKFMDKSKARVDVLMRTKDSDEKKFKENKIPWNAKIFTDLKIASLAPLITYMDIVLEEVENLVKISPEEKLTARKKALDKSLEHLKGAINFSFKVHQFTGGFTEACNTKFSEISSKTRELKNEIAALSES